MTLASPHDVIIRLRLLEHQPGRFHVLGSVAPVAHGFQIPKIKLFLQTLGNAGRRPRDFFGYKGFTAPRTLVIEKYAVHGKDIIGFAIISGSVEGKNFGGRIRASRVEWRGFALR